MSTSNIRYIATGCAAALALAATGHAGHAAAKPAAPASSAVDIGTLHVFARCLADRYKPSVRKLLALDHRSNAYDSRLWTLADDGASCLPFAFGELRSARVLLAGALAERLLPESLNGAPLAVRVAHDPAKPGVAARDDGEYLGLCTVRSMPEEVAELLATKPASAEERLVVGKIAPGLHSCVRERAQAKVNVAGLRALVALAAYRLSLHENPVAQRPQGN